MRMEQNYGRADLCELEPEAAACILRVIIRYVRAMVAVEFDSLEEDQKHTYIRTVKVCNIFSFS